MSAADIKKEPLTVDDLLWHLSGNFDEYIILDKIEIDHKRGKFTITFRECEDDEPKTIVI